MLSFEDQKLLDVLLECQSLARQSLSETQEKNRRTESSREHEILDAREAKLKRHLENLKAQIVKVEKGVEIYGLKW